MTDASSDRTTRAATILSAILIAVSVVLRAATAFTKSYSQDDFFWAYTAYLRSTPLVPYRDYYIANFTPLAEIFAPLFRIFPQSFIPLDIARALNLVVGFALLWSCYRVARLIGANILWALIVTNLVTWNLQFLTRICDVRSDQIGALCLMLALIMLLDPKVRLRALGVGLLCGMAGAITYKLVIAAPFLGLGVLWLSRRRIRDATVFTLATAFAPAAYFAWRLDADGLPIIRAIWRDVFGAVGSGVSERIPEFLGTAMTAPLTIIAVVAGAAGLLRASADPSVTTLRRLFVFCAAGFTIVYCYANPFLFPYNFVILCPMLAPLAVGLPDVLPTPRLTRWAQFILPIAALAGGTFGLSNIINRTKYHQEHTVRWIWAMTSPKDAFFDFQGFVAWRPSTYHWWMYSGLVPKYMNGWFSVEDEMRRAQVKIVLPNYRMTKLTPRDEKFVSEHFVSIDECLLMPGWVIKRNEIAEGVTIDAYLKDEEYLLQPAPPPGVVLIDGQTVGSRVRLKAGPHRVTVRPGIKPPKFFSLARITREMKQTAPPCEDQQMIAWFN